MNFIILSEKTWNKYLVNQLQRKSDHKWYLINRKDNFSFELIEKIKPNKIFIPHWSYIIPKEIYKTYECIVFHMTDLPYGRGGSPLQNLIVRGRTKTKISAFRVGKGIDTGDIYLKKLLCLNGSAEEIFIRANNVIKEMIFEIIKKDLKPFKQKGETVYFKRRSPEQSNIFYLKEIKDVFDYIRMLDAEDYPKAFFETESFRFEFSRASLKADKTIYADVRIIPK